MNAWLWLLVATALLVAAAVVVVIVFYFSGRREDARALAGFVPDCARLALRLMKDHRVPWHKKTLLAALALYLASPIDLIPGSPIDDAVIAALVLPIVLRGLGHLVEEHWPGPGGSLAVVRRVARVPLTSAKTSASGPERTSK